MLCVIARIDNAAEEKLASLCGTVAEFGVLPKQIYGHITLITYLGQDEAGFVNQCRIVLNERRPFSVIYDHIEVLSATSIVVASPRLTRDLTTLHSYLAEIAPTELDTWSSVGVWRPHTTLLYHPETDLEAIAQRMRKHFAPFPAQISSIEFSRVTENGYEIIDAIAL